MRKYDYINISIDYVNKSITIETEQFKRDINCPTFDSFIEQVRREFESIKEYNELLKRSDK